MGGMLDVVGRKIGNIARYGKKAMGGLKQMGQGQVWQACCMS